MAFEITEENKLVQEKKGKAGKGKENFKTD